MPNHHESFSTGEERANPKDGLNGAERLNGLNVLNQHFALQSYPREGRRRRHGVACS